MFSSYVKVSSSSAASSSSAPSGPGEGKVVTRFVLLRTKYEGKDKSRRKSYKSKDLSSHAALVSGMHSAAPGSSSAVMASLVDPDVVYDFRFVSNTTATAASSVWAGSVNFDPTSTSEWSSVSSLFLMYRLHSCRVTVVPGGFLPTTPGSSNPSLGCAVNLGEINTTPSTVNLAITPPNGRVISLLPGMPHKDYQWTTGDVSNRFEFQIVGSPGTVYAGSWGQFQYYGFAPATTTTFFMMFEYIVQMRGRA